MMKVMMMMMIWVITMIELGIICFIRLYLGRLVGLSGAIQFLGFFLQNDVDSAAAI